MPRTGLSSPKSSSNSAQSSSRLLVGSASSNTMSDRSFGRSNLSSHRGAQIAITKPLAYPWQQHRHRASTLSFTYRRQSARSGAASARRVAKSRSCVTSPNISGYLFHHNARTPRYKQPPARRVSPRGQTKQHRNTIYLPKTHSSSTSSPSKSTNERRGRDTCRRTLAKNSSTCWKITQQMASSS